jgi:hypothetical protein
MSFDSTRPYLTTTALNGQKFYWQAGSYYDVFGNAWFRLPGDSGANSQPMPDAGWRADGLAVLVAPDGTEVLVYPPLPQRQGASQFNAATLAGTVWFPMQEGSGTTIYDMFSITTAAMQGSGAMWGVLPGVNFSGTNELQVPYASPNPIASLKWIMPLATLLDDGSDSIVAWFVMTHPTALGTTAAAFYWGLSTTSSAPGGWGVRLSSNTNPFWLHTAIGASAQDSQNIGIAKFNGDAGTNTQTAFAMEISKNRKVPTVFQVRTAKRTIFTVPPDNPPASNTGQQDVAILSPYLRGAGTGGTGPCGYSANTTLTIGATCGTSSSNFSDAPPSGVSYVNMGFQRRKTMHGVSKLIAADLAADMYSFPKSAIL